MMRYRFRMFETDLEWGKATNPTSLGEIELEPILEPIEEKTDLEEEIVSLRAENAKLKEKGLRIYMHLRCFDGGPECMECEKYARKLYGYKKLSELERNQNGPIK